MDKKRILLVDDEVTFSRVLKLYLEETGRYLVRTEENGSRGVVAAREFHPDLILADIIMPDMDGGGMASQIKADPMTAQIPIVFLTAVVSREEATAHQGLIGNQLFIAKPVGAKEIIHYIEYFLGATAQTMVEGKAPPALSGS